MSRTTAFVYRVSCIVTLATTFASPVFAGSQKLAVVTKDVAAQQQQFHAALDTYLAANEKLETRITRSTTLDEQTRNHLLSLVQTEKSKLLGLRSRLFSTSNKREVQSLAKEAKQQRDAAHIQEDRIILPLLTLSNIHTSILPTAEARIESMDSTLTKSQYDKATKDLKIVKQETLKLHDALMGANPPADASVHVELLQTKTKNLYRDLRSKIK